MDHTKESYTEEDHAASEPDFYGKWLSVKNNPPKEEDEFLIWPHDKYAGISAEFWPFPDHNGKKAGTFYTESEYGDICIIEATHYMPVPEMKD